ncbi:type II toxin-antitoxin system HigB family toxin [Pseudomonas sp. NPDC089392]|uniref:type II toxin-antitoxin system HigB family toxin n=1 Tax=Pseudomonas sp. NPDC089392 TaxID=3364459 RepID=UPI0038085663
MRVVTHKRIVEAVAKWPQSATALESWYKRISQETPGNFSQMKALFPAVDLVGRFHVFDIGGNKIRLIAGVSYSTQQVYIKFVLSHAEYDKEKWKD